MIYIIGFLTGIIGGMGIGGGTILIPSLLIFTSISQQMAQSVNLLSSIPMTIAALIFHIKNKNVDFKVVPFIAISGILASIIGSLVSNKIDAVILKRIFGIFLFIMGVIEVKKGLKKTD